MFRKLCALVLFFLLLLSSALASAAEAYVRMRAFGKYYEVPFRETFPDPGNTVLLWHSKDAGTQADEAVAHDLYRAKGVDNPINILFDEKGPFWRWNYQDNIAIMHKLAQQEKAFVLARGDPTLLHNRFAKPSTYFQPYLGQHSVYLDEAEVLWKEYNYRPSYAIRDLATGEIVPVLEPGLVPPGFGKPDYGFRQDMGIDLVKYGQMKEFVASSGSKVRRGLAEVADSLGRRPISRLLLLTVVGVYVEIKTRDFVLARTGSDALAEVSGLIAGEVGTAMVEVLLFETRALTVPMKGAMWLRAFSSSVWVGFIYVAILGYQVNNAIYARINEPGFDGFTPEENDAWLMHIDKHGFDYWKAATAGFFRSHGRFWSMEFQRLFGG